MLVRLILFVILCSFASSVQAENRSAKDAKMSLMASLVALNSVPENHMVVWYNPETGNFGSSNWIGQFRTARGDLCRNLKVAFQTDPAESHIGCLTNQNTWIVDRQYMLAFAEYRHSNPSCIRFLMDARIGHDHPRFNTSICKIDNTIWQVHP